VHAQVRGCIVIGPADERQRRKADPRRNDLVRLAPPRGSPDQLAGQSEQTPAVF